MEEYKKNVQLLIDTILDENNLIGDIIVWIIRSRNVELNELETKLDSLIVMLDFNIKRVRHIKNSIPSRKFGPSIAQETYKKFDDRRKVRNNIEFIRKINKIDGILRNLAEMLEDNTAVIDKLKTYLQLQPKDQQIVQNPKFATILNFKAK